LSQHHYNFDLQKFKSEENEITPLLNDNLGNAIICMVK
jgi:hypothetical protein